MTIFAIFADSALPCSTEPIRSVCYTGFATLLLTSGQLLKLGSSLHGGLPVLVETLFSQEGAVIRALLVLRIEICRHGLQHEVSASYGGVGAVGGLYECVHVCLVEKCDAVPGPLHVTTETLVRTVRALVDGVGHVREGLLVWGAMGR